MEKKQQQLNLAYSYWCLHKNVKAYEIWKELQPLHLIKGRFYIDQSSPNTKTLCPVLEIRSHQW